MNSGLGLFPLLSPSAPQPAIFMVLRGNRQSCVCRPVVSTRAASFQVSAACRLCLRSAVLERGDISLCAFAWECGAEIVQAASVLRSERAQQFRRRTLYSQRVRALCPAEPSFLSARKSPRFLSQVGICGSRSDFCLLRPCPIWNKPSHFLQQVVVPVSLFQIFCGAQFETHRYIGLLRGRC